MILATFLVAPTLRFFKDAMVEMVRMEEMDVMEQLVFKDHQDPKGILVHQVDLEDFKVGQELWDQLDHKDLPDLLDLGVEV